MKNKFDDGGTAYGDSMMNYPKKKPSYWGWSLTDWQSYHVYKSRPDIPEITTRCHDTISGAYNAYVMPCQFEFSFMGYTFVSHANPDKKAYMDAGVPAGDWHISEIHSGFRLSFGGTRDAARASARKILIKNAKGLRDAMKRAMEINGAHQWNVKYFSDGKAD